LFPGYIHTRLPEIQPIVKKTCEEFGLRYTDFPDFWTAIKSHIALLYDYGLSEEDKEHIKKD
jgi:linoleoyl-CoA desaturase